MSRNSPIGGGGSSSSFGRAPAARSTPRLAAAPFNVVHPGNGLHTVPSSSEGSSPPGNSPALAITDTPSGALARHHAPSAPAVYNIPVGAPAGPAGAMEVDAGQALQMNFQQNNYATYQDTTYNANLTANILHEHNEHNVYAEVDASQQQYNVVVNDPRVLAAAAATALHADRMRFEAEVAVDAAQRDAVLTRQQAAQVVEENTVAAAAQAHRARAMQAQARTMPRPRP